AGLRESAPVAVVVLADDGHVAVERGRLQALLGQPPDGFRAGVLVAAADVLLDAPVDLDVGPVLGELGEQLGMRGRLGAPARYGVGAGQLALGHPLRQLVPLGEQFAGSAHALFLLSDSEMTFGSAPSKSAVENGVESIAPGATFSTVFFNSGVTFACSRSHRMRSLR